MSQFWVGGATGFLGSHMVKHLLEQGHTVVATSSRGGEVAGQKVERCDITSELEVAQSAKGCDGAFLCVGKVSRDPNDAADLHHLHVEGTRRCLAGLQTAGVPRVVFTSTSGTIAVGEQKEQLFTENDPAPMELIGAWPYYRTKLYAEREALAIHDAGGIEVVIVNPSQLLGPGDLRGSSTGDVRRFLERQLPAVPSGGLAFVDVRDAAIGMLAAFSKGRGGERYLLSGVNLTLAAFMQRLARFSGVSAPALAMPKGRTVGAASHGLMSFALSLVGRQPDVTAVDVEMGQCYWYCDCSKAERELGFSPRDGGITLRDTIDDLVARGAAFPRNSQDSVSLEPNEVRFR